MAFLNGIFGSQAQAPAPVAAPVVAPAPVAAPTPAPAQQPGNAAAQTQSPNSAMTTLMQLMTPSKEVLDAQKTQQEQMNAGIFPAVEPAKIKESLANADFTTGMNPEQVKAALSGDATAFMAVINQVAQNAVAANIQMTQGMVEHGVKTGGERFNAGLDSRFREMTLRNQNVENPVLNHPFAISMVQTFAKQIANANPKLSPQEAHKQAEMNFLQMNQEIAGTSAAQVEAKSKPAERDWMRYMEDGDVGSSQVAPAA